MVPGIEDKKELSGVDGAIISNRLDSLIRTSIEHNDTKDKVKRNLNSLVRANSLGSEKQIPSTERTALGKQTHAFRTLMHMMAHLNEAHNANTYIRDALDRDMSRMLKMNANAKRDVHREQQLYLAMNFQIHYKNFLIGVMIVTLFFTSLTSMTVAAWFESRLQELGFLLLAVIILGIYAVVLVSMFNNVSNRRRMHWKRFYWKIPEDANNSKKGSTCTS
jgi:hypothetical protein